MEFNIHREAGEVAHPQIPCSLGVLGLPDRVQGIQCYEASPAGHVGLWSTQAPGSLSAPRLSRAELTLGPCTFPRIS